MPADTSADRPALTIAAFDKALHGRSASSYGVAPIDNFLKSSLSDQIKARMVPAWISTAEDDPAVLGFYTLGALAVRSEFGPKTWQRARVPDVPVTYIRAVAVRQDTRQLRLLRPQVEQVLVALICSFSSSRISDLCRTCPQGISDPNDE